ncbi:MAG TPA: hypothetical protein VJK53_05030 [Candidatus Paceibacterota bacterium]
MITITRTYRHFGNGMPGYNHSLRVDGPDHTGRMAYAYWSWPCVHGPSGWGRITVDEAKIAYSRSDDHPEVLAIVAKAVGAPVRLLSADPGPRLSGGAWDGRAYPQNLGVSPQTLRCLRDIDRDFRRPDNHAHNMGAWSATTEAVEKKLVEEIPREEQRGMRRYHLLPDGERILAEYLKYAGTGDSSPAIFEVIAD